MLKSVKKANIDLILLLFIEIAAVKFTYSIDTITDIFLSDETVYLQRGVQLKDWGFPKEAWATSWASLYLVWYYLLSLIESDRVLLYYLNYKLLVISTTGLLYLILRGLKVNLFYSAIASCFYLVSNVPAAWPYITLFALLVMLIFLNWAIRLSSEENFYLVAQG